MAPGRGLWEATQAGPAQASVSQGGAWKPRGVTFLLEPLCPAHSEAPGWGQVGGIVTGLLGPELSLCHGRAGTSGGYCPPEANRTVQQGREQQGTCSPSQEAGLQVWLPPTPAPRCHSEGRMAGSEIQTLFSLEGSSSLSSQECKRSRKWGSLAPFPKPTRPLRPFEAAVDCRQCSQGCCLPRELS